MKHLAPPAAYAVTLTQILTAVQFGITPVEKAPVPASVSSVTLLASNANRKLGSVFANNSLTSTLYLSFSATATTNSPRILPPGSIYIMDDSNYTGVVSGIWDIAEGQCNIEESL